MSIFVVSHNSGVKYVPFNCKYHFFSVILQFSKLIPKVKNKLFFLQTKLVDCTVQIMFQKTASSFSPDYCFCKTPNYPSCIRNMLVYLWKTSACKDQTVHFKISRKRAESLTQRCGTYQVYITCNIFSEVIQKLFS